MITIAGLAGLDHPLVGEAFVGRPFDGSETTFPISDCFVAVADKVSHGGAEERYALAARWCAAGPFVPFSWRDRVYLQTIERIKSEQAGVARAMIAACADHVELAFSIAYESPTDSVDGQNVPSQTRSGRDYLRALSAAHDVGDRFISRLHASARDGGFSVSIIAVGRQSASGLVRCSRNGVEATRVSLACLAKGLAGVHLDIQGPLPPFGAGAELKARLGLVKSPEAA